MNFQSTGNRQQQGLTGLQYKPVRPPRSLGLGPLSFFGRPLRFSHLSNPLEDPAENVGRRRQADPLAGALAESEIVQHHARVVGELPAKPSIFARSPTLKARRATVEPIT
jgi:hypothetical protein